MTTVTKKPVESEIVVPPENRIRLPFDLKSDIVRRGYTHVHVAGMGYGGDRDLHEYIRYFERLQRILQRYEINISYSLVPMSESGRTPFRKLAAPDGRIVDESQEFLVVDKDVPPWGDAIPRDARKLLYGTWEDKTYVSGRSARSGPIGLAYYMAQGRIPEGEITLIADVDGAGFVPFTALRLYHRNSYRGYLEYLRSLAESPVIRSEIDSMKTHAPRLEELLSDLFVDRRSDELPEWSFAEDYRSCAGKGPEMSLAQRLLNIAIVRRRTEQSPKHPKPIDRFSQIARRIYYGTFL